MAINIQKTFGQNSGNVQSGSNDDRPKAEFWLNFGYESDHVDEDGTRRFVSLATGIALDTQETLPTNSRNRLFAAFNQARNQLRDDLVEQAKANLQPGEAVIICKCEESGLAVQLRRVNGEAEEIPLDQNPFARKSA